MTPHRVVEIAEIVLRVGVVRCQSHLLLVSNFCLLRIAAVEIGIAQSTERRRIIWVETDGYLVSFNRLVVLLVVGKFVGFINETGRFAGSLLLGLTTAASLGLCSTRRDQEHETNGEEHRLRKRDDCFHQRLLILI